MGATSSKVIDNLLEDTNCMYLGTVFISHWY